MSHEPVEGPALQFSFYLCRIVAGLAAWGAEIQWNLPGRRFEGVEQIFVLVQPGLGYDF